MPQQSLIEYIQKLLQQGYDVETIRTTLLTAGYTPHDVNTALRIAQHKKTSLKPILFIFAIIFVLALGIILAITFIKKEPVTLTFTINPLSTELQPGEELILTTIIQNPSEQQTTALIDYRITGPEIITAPTQTVTVAARTTLSTTIPFPETAQQGSYTLTVTLSYLDKRSTQRIPLQLRTRETTPTDILVQAPEEQAKKTQLTCPGGCDDLNFCTTDTCAQGQCKHTAIIPCCGNNQCEPGETATSCPPDCGTQRALSEDTTTQALAQARSNINAAIDTCNSMGQRAFIDNCLSAISDTSKDKTPCADIVDTDIRDSCYIPFAYENDYSVCDEITNPYLKNSCTTLQHISQYQE